MHITEDTFEQVLQSFHQSDAIDLRDASFIDPYGMVGILEIGELLKHQGIRKTLILPDNTDIIKYLERLDFFAFAGDYFDIKPSVPELAEKYLRSAESDVLLEITPIEKADDIHFIVGKVKERAHMILTRHLNYDEDMINRFAVALSEVCQNIVEHSENKGFVGIQKYHFQNIKKNVVKIAVMDAGVGFKTSLSQRFTIKDDFEAIQKAIFEGASRYEEEGRGHGLISVRKFVERWNGKLSIRSGTAKLSLIPDWSKGRKKTTGLVQFPGAQILIMLPEV